MSKPLAFGLNLTKKPSASKPAPPKRRPLFGGDDDDDDSDTDAANREGKAENIGEFDESGAPSASKSTSSTTTKTKNGLSTQPPKLKAKAKARTNAMFGDLSSSLTSRRNAEAALQVDASVYEYDSVYDSFKPQKQITKEDEERRPKYMRSLMQAAEVRKRDALIAEEKKIAREREAEGAEYEGKEKFVTEAYRKQQEENKRIEEEERRREEEEAKKNKGGGMSAFYRKLLDKDEQRHAHVLQAAEEKAKNSPQENDREDEQPEEKAEADVARELNEKGASVALNEDGQVVDKRQLLRGGLNVGAKKKESVQREADRPAPGVRKDAPGQQVGRKQAMRERQSRMLEEQLEQSLKRSREEEEAQRQEVERVSKSRKTEGDISSAKERYLARKRAAEEEKKKAAAQGN